MMHRYQPARARRIPAVWAEDLVYEDPGHAELEVGLAPRPSRQGMFASILRCLRRKGDL